MKTRAYHDGKLYQIWQKSPIAVFKKYPTFNHFIQSEGINFSIIDLQEEKSCWILPDVRKNIDLVITKKKAEIFKLWE